MQGDDPAVEPASQLTPDHEMLVEMCGLVARVLQRMPWVESVLAAGIGLFVYPFVAHRVFLGWAVLTIGVETIQTMREAGARVLLHGRSAERLGPRVAELRQAGRAADAVGFDMADRAAMRQALAGAGIGPVDVLIHNVGERDRRPFDAIEPDDFARLIDVDLSAAHALIKLVVPGMVERGFGRILLVSSVAALNGGLVGPHYAASKAALHGLMHHLAPRVAGSGVTVNTIAPALIAGTRMLPGDDGPGSLPAPIPVGHLGQPEDIADMALAMLTNPYLTSKVITVDGGIYPA